MASRRKFSRNRRVRAGAVAVSALVVPTAVLLPGAGAGAQAPPDPATSLGSFSKPFVEPTVSDFTGHPRVKTDARCVERPGREGARQGGLGRGFIDCKPAAGGLVQLMNGKSLYWDNLAGTENIDGSILAEYGVVGLNDQTRVLDVSARKWTEPTPVDGGALSKAKIEPIVPGDILRSTEEENDGSLFCADGNFLADGRFLATGGTKYVNDPGNDISKFASTELLGIENTRIYDPDTNRWSQTGSMHRARWYPSVTTLGNGRQFVVSGLRRLVKPVNTTDPVDPSLPATGLGVQEGQNERETETFDPKTNKWTLNGPNGRRSLPLFARMHLLPNGHVLYNAAGQAFNPLGQAYDQALWNIAASYDPAAKKWKDLGIPGVGVSPVPGFRGSTFSVMMPLKADSDGKYTKASFLTAGGVTGGIAAPSPGSYVALKDSFLTTIDTAKGNALSNQDAGDMADTTLPGIGRWYGSGTLLPTGEVLATSGADRDEVAVPGLESPVRTAELYDPKTKTWRKVARQNRPRTYHNTANLMRDGKVLIGGHATISNSYTRNLTIPGGVTAPNDGRDPTFEVYSPPYLSCPGRQARIGSVEDTADTLTIETDVPASEIENVVLVRNPTTTHITDADQRNVELKILSRSGSTITVPQAKSGNAVPPGPYMLFVNRKVDGCVKPSISEQMIAAANGRVSLAKTCLAGRSPIGPRNIGRIALGRSRKALTSSARLTRIRTVSKSRTRYRYCVKGTSRRVVAVFGRKAKVELVATTAPRHGNRGVRVGSSSAKMRRKFPNRMRLAKNLYRAAPGSRRLIGTRKGKVRFFAVASKRVISRKSTLRVYLRRAGVR